MTGALDGVPFWAQKTTRVTGTGGDDGQVCGDGGGMPRGKGRGSGKENSAAALPCLPRWPRHRTEEGGGRGPEGNATGVEAKGDIVARGRLSVQPQGGGVGVWWWWGEQLPLGEAAGRGPLSTRAKREPATLTARPRDGVC